MLRMLSRFALSIVSIVLGSLAAAPALAGGYKCTVNDKPRVCSFKWLGENASITWADGTSQMFRSMGATDGYRDNLGLKWTYGSNSSTGAQWFYNEKTNTSIQIFMK